MCSSTQNALEQLKCSAECRDLTSTWRSAYSWLVASAERKARFESFSDAAALPQRDDVAGERGRRPASTGLETAAAALVSPGPWRLQDPICELDGLNLKVRWNRWAGRDRRRRHDR